MTDNDTSTDTRIPRPWQPRFGVGTMLMVMLVLSVMAASGSYMVRGLQGDGRFGYLIFILFTLAAPMLLMVAVSILRQIAGWINRRQ